MKIKPLLVACLLLAACDKVPAPQESFAGLGSDAANFAQVVPGKVFSFPEDHGPHADFRIEWWYVTANLKDAQGNVFGVQWTLFRNALKAGPVQAGWHDATVWLGHAAVTSATHHYAAERYARGGVGQAGARQCRSTPGSMIGISPPARVHWAPCRTCNSRPAVRNSPTTCT